MHIEKKFGKQETPTKCLFCNNLVLVFEETMFFSIKEKGCKSYK